MNEKFSKKTIMHFKEILDYTKKDKEIWFTGDLHIGHTGIIKHSRSEFNNTKEMNKTLIDSLSIIKSNNFLFDLGDMFWKSSDIMINSVLDKINTTNIWKILGNHDKEAIYNISYIKNRFIGISETLDLTIKYDKNRTIGLVLCHYPLVSWSGKSRGVLMIHGHCHGNLDNYNKISSDLRVDIGWDSILGNKNIVPLSKIIEYFDTKTNGEKYSVWVKKNHKKGTL